MPNLELEPKRSVSAFRKMALGTWDTPYEAQVHGTMDLRMEEALRYLEAFRKKTGRRLTVSHLMAKAMGEVLRRCPDANAIIRWNRIYLRKRIAVFFQVLMNDQGEDKVDLSGATVYDVEQKSLVEIYDDFTDRVNKVRSRKDDQLEQNRGMFLKIPYLVLNLVLKVMSFFLYTLNMDLSSYGLPRDPFGSVMITNVGSLGLDLAYPPLVNYTRVPLLLAIGAVKDQPVVDNGELRPGKIMRVNATFDHRLIDGFHAAVMSKVLKEWIEHPFDHFDRIDDLPAALPAAAGR